VVEDTSTWRNIYPGEKVIHQLLRLYALSKLKLNMER
jgi:hypothetical protein